MMYVTIPDTFEEVTSQYCICDTLHVGDDMHYMPSVGACTVLTVADLCREVPNRPCRLCSVSSHLMELQS